MDNTISTKDFIQQFRPVKNPFVRGGPWDGCHLEQFGSELQHVLEVQADQPGKVWTVREEEGTLVLTSGFHLKNCMGFVITAEALPVGQQLSVSDSEQWQTEEGAHAAAN